MSIATIVRGGSIVMLIALAIQAQQTHNENWTRCSGTDNDLIIAGCTAVIQAGGQTPEQQAQIFFKRGLSYVNKKLYDLAIQDFDQALRLNPNADRILLGSLLHWLKIAR